MDSQRDAARFLRDCSDQAARETRALGRGTVESIRDDGRPIILLPTGGRVLSTKPRLSNTMANGQAWNLVRNGNRWEAFAQSAFGGGLGGTFQAPEP